MFKNISKTLLIIFLFLLIIFFIYIFLKNKNIMLDDILLKNDEKENKIFNNEQDSSYLEEKIEIKNSNDVLYENKQAERVFFDNLEGMSFVLPLGWSIIENTNDFLKIESQDNMLTKGDLITIRKYSGFLFESFDAKFGPFSLEFDENKKCWLVGEPNKDTEEFEKVCKKESEMIIDGKSVFITTERWKTYVIALNSNTFIEINITGSGDISALEELKNSIYFK